MKLIYQIQPKKMGVLLIFKIQLTKHLLQTAYILITLPYLMEVRSAYFI
jgi:hypothetical protein